MSALLSHTNWTVQEYLDFERGAETRHEFIAGHVYAMAGASDRHNQITSAVHYGLYGQLLKRPSQVFQSDIRVLAGTCAFFYPDLIVVCDEAQYQDEARDTLLNPTVIIEILSPSTEDYDRGRKFTHYRSIASLQDYVLISQKQLHVEHYTRQGADTWLLTDFKQSEHILNLVSIGCTLLLRDIYRKVNFDGIV